MGNKYALNRYMRHGADGVAMQKMEDFAEMLHASLYDYRGEMIYIFDLDGTLADITHRIHHIVKPRGQVADWESFFKACVDDKPIIPALFLLKSLAHFDNKRPYDQNAYIWIVSGRSSVVAKETMDWLDKNGVKYHALFMREKSDHRPDYVIKEEWFNALSKFFQKRIVCVFEDRKSVVDMWRRNGIMCCQVAEGNF